MHITISCEVQIIHYGIRIIYMIFFEKNEGYEFIGFDNAIDYSIRVKYYIPFSEHGKLRGVSGHLIGALENLLN